MSSSEPPGGAPPGPAQHDDRVQQRRTSRFVWIQVLSAFVAAGLVAAVAYWWDLPVYARLLFGVASLVFMIGLVVLRGAARLVAAADATGLFAAAVLSPAGPWLRAAFAVAGVVFMLIVRELGAVVWPDVAVLFVLGFAAAAAVANDGTHGPPTSTHAITTTVAGSTTTIIATGSTATTTLAGSTARTTLEGSTTTTTLAGSTVRTTLEGSTATTTLAGATTTTTLPGSTETKTEASSTSTVITTVPPRARLVIRRFRFEPDPASDNGSQATFWIEDTNGKPVKNALVYVLGLAYWGLPATWRASGTDGRVTVRIPVPRSRVSSHGRHVVVFVRAERLSDGATARRLFRFRLPP